MSTYNGNPDNYPIAVTLFDDGSPPNASQFNPEFEAAIDLARNARAYIMSVALGNWYSASAPNAANNIYYAYDPVLGRWAAAYDSGGSNNLYTTVDGGRTWVFQHSLTSFPAACSTTQAAGYILVFGPNGGGPNIRVDRLDALGNYASGTFASIAPTGVVASYFHNQVIVGANFVSDTNLFCWTQSGGSFTGNWFIGTDANGYVTGPSWFDMSSSLPVGFASGTNHVGQFLVADTTGNIRPAVAGDIQCVALCGVTPGTDTPRLMKVLANTPSAATITDVTANLPAPGPSYIISGLGYDIVNQLWGLVLQTAAAGTYLYSSPDLVTWTLCHHFGDATCYGLAMTGGTWATWAGANSVRSADSVGRVLYSWNVASKGSASVWAPAAMQLNPFGAGTPGAVGVLISNGSQLLAGQVASSSATAKAAISYWAGLALGSGVY